MIKFMGQSDYWDTLADVRVNTVNCVGVMGKGIAKDFKIRFPEMFQHYAAGCRKNLLNPGGIHHFDYPSLRILNVATKDHWKDPSQYEWVEKGIINLKWYFEQAGPTARITVPAMGCGNGGLCWSNVANTMAKHWRGMSQIIHVFNPLGQAAFNMEIP